KRSQERGEQRYAENRQVLFVGDRENRVLAKESAERRTTDQCQGAGSECRKSDRKFSTQTTHLPDVLLVVENHDDRARREKQKRLKKCVSEKMEHRCLVGGETHRHHHVTEL